MTGGSFGSVIGKEQESVVKETRKKMRKGEKKSFKRL